MPLRVRVRKDRVEFSRQHFVPHQMQPHPRRRGPVKIKRLHRLTHIRAQLVPRIGLGEDTLPQCLGHKAPIALLCDLENQLVYRRPVTPAFVRRKRRVSNAVFTIQPRRFRIRVHP